MYSSGNGFIKQVRLSGKEKAAVLLGELGFDTTENLMKYFSEDEIKKIQQGFSRVGRAYDSGIENDVLTETVSFGISRNILPPDTIIAAEQNAVHAAAVYQKNKKEENNILAKTGINTEDLARVLSMWLGED